MQTLTSARNPALKEIRKAVQRGSLTSDGLCVAEGFHLLNEALRSRVEIDSVFATEAAAEAVERRLPADKQRLLNVLPPDLFRTIVSTETTQGVVSLVVPPQWTLEQLLGGKAMAVILDGIQDPGNAGAILRAAEAFGATGVLFLKGSVNPFNPKALRASAGSIFRVPVVVGGEEGLLQGITLYALMPGAGRSPAACQMNESCGLVVGGEAHGVSASLQARSTAMHIPTLGVESLNAAMAATIVLYEAHKQRMELSREPV
jgi:TrmH family RNA methyltransferase